MFGTLLVANRGEIARRVIRTARALGIRTVAVHSDADAAALHVREADTAVRLGPPPPADSYLRADRVVAAALETGADAVHPGYGFLAENAAFAQAVVDAGVAWVGPDAATIAALGDKVRARSLVAAAGFPLVPGTDDPVVDADEAVAHAADLGYPVMVKASAGGGGIGMRIASDPESLRTAFEATAARPSASSPTARSCWSATSPTRATSRCRSWGWATAASSRWGSGSARSSAATRRSPRRRRAWHSTTACGRACTPPRSGPPRR